MRTTRLNIIDENILTFDVVDLSAERLDMC